MDCFFSGSLWEMAGFARVITFIGAGGKTTCLRSLTHEIDSRGLQVVATTTTKVFPEEQLVAWKNSHPPLLQPESARFWYVREEAETGKWIGPPLDAVDEALRDDILRSRFWVIEGDGARRRKLKCWGPNEPQIPLNSDCAVLVLDRGLWGNVLQENQVHRSECCPDLIGQLWKAEIAWDYFLRAPVFHSQYRHISWVILLNSPGRNSVQEEFDYIEPIEPLQDLSSWWKTEIQQDYTGLKPRPKHLRLAAGNAKEGKLVWCDLW